MSFETSPESDRSFESQPLLENTSPTTTTKDDPIPSPHKENNHTDNHASQSPSSTSTTELKHQIAQFLDSHTMHWTILALTLIDMLIVFAEIVFTLNDQCPAISPPGTVEGISSTTTSTTTSSSSLLELLGSTSTTILFIFAIEIALRFYASGVQYFLHHKLHLLDAMIVLVSLIFEFTLEGWAETVFSLLIVTRAWRVVRVMDAVILTVSETAEGAIEKLEKENLELKKEVGDLKKKERMRKVMFLLLARNRRDL
ncbi:hypothetical protein BDR26DRAFT_939330 [Obelidium mucronatum]|nr:hypothetical protein BDR26DRAFT_939330 [Obelidium mucronatum]